MVNQVSKLDNYPIPKTEDLLASLGTWCKVYQAYQQMTLDEQPRKFTTINTHKGLLQYNSNILAGGKDDNNHLANLEAVLKEVVRNWIAAAERELLF